METSKSQILDWLKLSEMFNWTRTYLPKAHPYTWLLNCIMRKRVVLKLMSFHLGLYSIEWLLMEDFHSLILDAIIMGWGSTSNCSWSRNWHFQSITIDLKSLFLWSKKCWSRTKIIVLDGRKYFRCLGSKMHSEMNAEKKLYPWRSSGKV